ncbi:hypothetical protein HBB16_07065 [Pseudonocardia sp. MCCB 268]|nr:hypothetical protein [Pseudonocardia cytotoxica]
MLYKQTTTNGIDSTSSRTTTCATSSPLMFVATPLRWWIGGGWRPHTEVERVATANYYRQLGRHMGIRGDPGDPAGVLRAARFYEARHFGYRLQARGR